MALLQAASGPDLAAQLRGVLDGGLFVLQSALSLGAAIATVLVLAPMQSRRAVAAALAFALLAVASGWLPERVPGGVLAPAALLLLGAVIATGFRARGVIAWIAIAIGGIAAGVAGGFQTATLAESAGGAAVLFMLVAVGLLLVGQITLPERAIRAVTLARRMAGAWIAAVGILLVALWLRRGG
ncbi:MAG: hypothetical protein ACJ8GO_20290 [Ramlibacter sp.]